MATTKSRRSTTHTITEGIHEFEVTFEPCDYHDIHVKISESGMKAVVGYLAVDDDPSNPRKEFDNVGTMVCWHSRYNLGDEQRSDSMEDLMKELVYLESPDHDADKIDAWIEKLWGRFVGKCAAPYGSREYNEACQSYYSAKEEYLNKIVEKHYLMLPLWLYDHSGLAMSTGSFNDRWDSGLVGVIFCTKKRALQEWGGGGKVLTKKVKERAIGYLKREVADYDLYLKGESYGVCYEKFINVGTVEEPEWEQEDYDSCFGYLGSKYAEEELDSGMQYHDKWLEAPIPEYIDPNQLQFFEGAAI